MHFHLSIEEFQKNSISFLSHWSLLQVTRLAIQTGLPKSTIGSKRFYTFSAYIQMKCTFGISQCDVTTKEIIPDLVDDGPTTSKT